MDTSARKARTVALRDERLRLRLQSVQRQRESGELRSACEEAVRACHSTIEVSKARKWPQTTAKNPRLDMGRQIIQALTNGGFSAVLFEPPPDTAHRS
jgi:hypothetical protein